MLVEARQSFQFFRQSTCRLENNRVLPLVLPLVFYHFYVKQVSHLKTR